MNPDERLKLGEVEAELSAILEKERKKISNMIRPVATEPKRHHQQG